MKKIFYSIVIVPILLLFLFSVSVQADALNSVTVDVDKQTVHPGETIKVTVNFGQDLGAYTVDVAYDNNVLEYVSAEGGTANNQADKVRVVFHDETGGSNPRSSMSVTFRAKADITTSNPTNFSVTAEGLANPDASISYDDITSGIIKDIVVEPQYEDYAINLTHAADLIKEKENEMKLIITSAMGKNYDHARIMAEATTPSGATAKLLATDQTRAEYDLIESGFGDASGYKIGGKDMRKELDLRGVFSDAGSYGITIKLIDRDNSDAVIVQKTFNLTVAETPVQAPEEPEENLVPNPEEEKEEEKQEEELPKALPKTGINYYSLIANFVLAISVIILIVRTVMKKENN